MLDQLTIIDGARIFVFYPKRRRSRRFISGENVKCSRLRSYSFKLTIDVIRVAASRERRDELKQKFDGEPFAVIPKF